MNGKKAKVLRHLARRGTVGHSARTYKYRHGKAVTGQLVLSPDCTHALYRKLKQAYKWRKSA